MSISSDDSQLADIIQKALNSKHPLVNQAMDEEKNFRQRTAAEVEKLDSLIRKMISTKTEKEIKLLQKAILERMNVDLELSKTLNTKLKSYGPTINPNPSKEECTYPLKFNKLELILEGAIKLLPEYFKKLENESNDMPIGYKYKTQPIEVTHLGPNLDKIYGDSKGTFLKAALLETYLTLGGKLEDLKSNDQKGDWIDGTAIAHVAHIPYTLKKELADLDERFKDFTFFLNNALLFVHSGYTYGGDRSVNGKGPIRPNKSFPPKDCSSFIEGLLPKPFIVTTADQLLLNRQKLGITDNIPKEWLDTTFIDMDNTFGVVAHWQQDPQKYIEPGQIYAYRNFNLQSDPKKETLGSGGHTGVVICFKSDMKDSAIVIVNYNRNMPDVEGYGISKVPLSSEPDNKIRMLFSVKGKNVGNAKLESSNVTLLNQNLDNVTTKLKNSKQ